MSTSRRITQIPYSDLVKLFEADGFSIARTRGDHLIMTKTGVRRPVVIKRSPRMVSIDHIRSNMRTAGMSRERFFRLLDNI
ncbi:MAG: type II toxin-antitoxin system HicA family toxin [Dehalococcoidia bacterium]|nr:type II toxin-antitoxin system HicA family toxin [Dehalococcoidia bacterium]MYD51271.1 type II toxin-antitoxin system HicA family toxin [Dehalococcoidia bacterium]